MKTIFIIIIITFVLGISGYLLLVQSSKSVIYNGLSKRAQEYIHTQKTKANEQWSLVDVSSEKQKQNFQDPTITNGCFQLTVPFTVLKNKSVNSCNQYITFDSPRGELTAYQVTAETATLDENPGLIMRRANKNMYNESKVDVNGRDYIVFKEKADNFKEIAFSQQDKILFVVNINAYTNDDLSSQFNQVLQSIVYK